MAIKKAKWMKPLTQKELRHLADGSPTGKPSIISLQHNLKHQNDTGITCFECRHIAFKLNLQH